MTLGAAFARGHNNFDLMRLAGAVLVLMSHAFVLTGRAEEEPFARAMAHYADGGSLAVGMFFVISGFLIARSAERSVGRPWAFVRARFLRIWPALAVAALVQTVLFGLVFTRLPVAVYLRDGATWAALGRALVFSPALGLPGVFEDNPVPLAVNGSLWTLRFEVLCYAGLLGMAVLGLLRPGWMLLGLVGAFGLVGATVAARLGWLPGELASLRVVSVLACGVNALAGAALWVFRGRVPHHWGVVAVGGVVLVAGAGGWLAPVLFQLCLPYLVVWLGLSRVVVPVPRWYADVSYGVYLYAFPVEQGVVAWLGPGIGPWGVILVALPVALALGVLSRWLVEGPCLRFRSATVSPAASA